MSHQIIKQPNGLYAVWSSNVDHFILLDATPKEIVDFETKEATRGIERSVELLVESLDKGGKPYYQFTMSWDKAVEMIERIHKETLAEDKTYEHIKTKIGVAR